MQDPKADSNPWLPFRRPQTGRVSVFCLPFAGGGASAFRPWIDRAAPHLQICPVQLPGRENRLREPAIRTMDQLVDELTRALHPHFGQPFILFGHSMGATIAFELARHLLKQEKTCGLQHLVVSARRPPDEASPRRPLHPLPEREFIEELRRLRGTPEAVLADAELMTLLMPLLRADFELIETHHRAAGSGLDVNCTVMGGWQDELAESSLRGWRRHLQAEPELLMLEGGHFYLQDQRERILDHLASIARAHLHAADRLL